ncbi:MAG: S49 family peptidase [Phycisphaera sp. TMED24]|nr:MAG: S49 family peptidase [Phycisphaera sp. TMED24]
MSESTPPTSPSNVPPATPQVVYATPRSGGAAGVVLGVFAALMLAVLVAGGAFIFGLAAGAAGSSAGAVDVQNDVVRRTVQRGDRETQIAIIPVEGAITDQTASEVSAAVARAQNDNVDAVLLRVDSPGGGVTPSDRIDHDLQKLRDADIPVFASYGGISASGGVYVSARCERIMAEPTCVTGSIGVIASVLTMEGLAEKIGVEANSVVATRSPEKAVANDLWRNWDEKDYAKIRKILDSAYDRFRMLVEEGRSERLAEGVDFDDLCNGNVFTANEALELGLIDAIGYQEDAVAMVEQALGVNPGEANVFRYERRPDPFEQLGLGLMKGPSIEERIRSAGTPVLEYRAW